jgi:hypothetical protein
LPLIAQTGIQTVAVTVRETAGIRRSAFPAVARVPLARGAFREAPPARLLLNGSEVPSQATAMERWPDGSVRWMDVDFNASPGPLESLTYAIEYGAGVAPPAPGRGLTLTELGDGIQIGNVRVSRAGSPLIVSVKYRGEAIGAGDNGFFVADEAGTAHALASAADLELSVIKRGPLVAALRYAGALTLGASRVPFTVSVEMPSSKSWIKLSADVSDPGRQVRGLSLATPLALGPWPWVWDLGTSRWTYGQLRAAGDRMRFERTAAAADWAVTTTINGRTQMAETAPQRAVPFAGWAHVQGASEVVAFAVEGTERHAGGVAIELAGDGQSRISLTAAAPGGRHQLTVYEHFVSMPVQIGAATAPPAILSPLVVSLDPR